MPKERRVRTYGHEPSAKVAKRQFAVQDNAVQHVDVGASAGASGDVILQRIDAEAEPRNSVKKKDKLVRKHELFIERLEASRSPYSKSHNRRLKRKEREQIGGGLGDMKAAISAVEKDVAPEDDAPQVGNAGEEQPSQQKRSAQRPGQIGKGKGAPLSQAQRKRALKAEQMRQPMILANAEFSANPFQVIRTHAQNTLVQRQSS